ncbi:hypothetical protein AN161_11765 [Lysinibacillus sp. FJAT-14222]|nr:hypothetical protein AN161_11765 [Lysinibacillus sp. FJAT-14222]
MLSKKGILSTLFSVVGLICVACFYYFQLKTAWLFFVGAIMFVMSFKKREKGFWEYTPMICF